MSDFACVSYHFTTFWFFNLRFRTVDIIASTECVLSGQLTVFFVSICAFPVGLIASFFGEYIAKKFQNCLNFLPFLCCL